MIYEISNPHFLWMLVTGYDGSMANEWIRLRVISNIFKSQNCKYPQPYRKWPQLLIDTKNCNYQRFENVVITASLISSTWNFWDTIIQYHKSDLTCFLDSNTVFDKSDFYKIVSIDQRSVIFGLLARYANGHSFCEKKTGRLYKKNCRCLPVPYWRAQKRSYFFFDAGFFFAVAMGPPSIDD